MFLTSQTAQVRRFMLRMAGASLFGVLLVMSCPTSALAAHKPSQAPKAGDMAVSANLGFSHAFDDNFEGVEPLLTGTFEYYTTPRVSWRALLGFTSFDADNPSDAEVEHTFINGNVLYNWEGGYVQPYVTGGVDWFVGERWAIKFEGTIHVLAGEEPNDFLLGSAGVKWWF